MAKFNVKLTTRDAEFHLLECDVPDGQTFVWEPDPMFPIEGIARFVFFNTYEHKASDQEIIEALRRRVAELEEQVESMRRDWPES